MFRCSPLWLLHAITTCHLVIGKTICEDQSCAMSMAKIVEQEQHEIEGARLGLLQGRAKPMSNSVDSLTSVKKERSSQLAGCPRVDARKLSTDDLKKIREPTILEHAVEIKDDTTWAFSEFEADGIFGNITTVDYGKNPENKDCAAEVNGVTFPKVPLHERLEVDSWVVRIRKCFDGIEEMIASISERNEGVTESPFALFSEELMTQENVFVTLAVEKMWSPVHTHAETMYVQVAGSKGWLFGDPDATDRNHTAKIGEETGLTLNEPANTTEEMHPTFNVLPYTDLDGRGICDVFFEDTLPESVSERRQHFRACETHPCEALFWPGLCEGRCGWWHGACGLGWSAGIAHIGFANPEDKMSRL